MLKIKRLKKYYKENIGIDDVSLNIKKGEIFGFIGPNGAGKSTTIKCVLDFLKPNDGTIEVVNKKEIGYLPGEVNLYEDMKVSEMIKYNDSFYKKNCMPKAKKLIKKLELKETLKISELSLGNKKKLGIILALMHSPKLIILDEPTSGLDPLMQEIFFEILLKEKEEGNAIFFSSHNLNEVKKVCDRVAIIKSGKIVKIEDIKSINNDQVYKIILKTKEKLDYPKINEIYNFTYDKDINKLLKELSKIKIEFISIEEPSLEDIFMHYYKED